MTRATAPGYANIALPAQCSADGFHAGGVELAKPGVTAPEKPIMRSYCTLEVCYKTCFEKSVTLS